MAGAGASMHKPSTLETRVMSGPACRWGLNQAGASVVSAQRATFTSRNWRVPEWHAPFSPSPGTRHLLNKRAFISSSRSLPPGGGPQSRQAWGRREKGAWYMVHTPLYALTSALPQTVTPYSLKLSSISARLGEVGATTEMHQMHLVCVWGGKWWWRCKRPSLRRCPVAPTMWPRQWVKLLSLVRSRF